MTTVFGIAAAFTVAVLVVAWQLRLALREDRAAALVRLRAIHGTTDTQPGTNAADQDVCELLWNVPAYAAPDMATGLDRLRAAIRDEQNGDQG